MMMHKCKVVLLIAFGALVASFQAGAGVPAATLVLQGSTGIGIHDFFYQGQQLMAVTGGGCQGGECVNGKSSFHSIDTTSWTANSIASVPDANGMPGAAYLNGSMYVLTGESEPDNEQVLLRVNPQTGAILENYGQISFDGNVDSQWCNEMDTLSGKLILNCWQDMWEISQIGQNPEATLLVSFDEDFGFSDSYAKGLVIDDLGDAYVSFCDRPGPAEGVSFVMRISGLLSGSPTAWLSGPSLGGQLFMALGHYDGKLIGSRYTYDCGFGQDSVGSRAGQISTITWEGANYPQFTPPAGPSTPVPTLSFFSLLALGGLLGLIGLRKLKK